MAIDFNKKTWVDRDSEYLNGRTITDRDTGEVKHVLVGLDEGDVYTEGTPQDADTFNDLEDRIAQAFDEVPEQIDAYTKAETDSLLADKADKSELPTNVSELTNDSDYQTGTEVESAISSAVSALETEISGKADKATTYTKTEVDTALSAKANTSDVETALASKADTATTYTKTEVDTALADKADKSNTYTKSEVDTIIENLPEPMIFKGTLGVNGTITDLPVASSANEGSTYKVITDGTYAGQTAKVGDVFTSNGSEWVLIPSGDEENDTWREIKVNGTTVLNSAISSGAVDFVEGDNIEVTFNSTGNKVLIKTKNVYTKSEVDTALANKADSDNVYTKSEIDTMLILDVTNVGV